MVILAAVTLFLTGGGKRTLKMPRERNKRAARVLVRERNGMFWDIETARVIPTRKNIYIRCESAARPAKRAPNGPGWYFNARANQQVQLKLALFLSSRYAAGNSIPPSTSQSSAQQHRGPASLK